MRMLLGALVIWLFGCGESPTVVTISVPGADGGEAPAAGQILVMLPYDRDSILATIGARWLTARPDTTELVRLLDSLRGSNTTHLAANDRLNTLRAAQHAWRDSAYGSYDSITFALTERLARDPFADTTDARGITVVRPSKGGPWWVTATAWDATDPYSEWYWNLPLAGDTLHLSVANAHHRRRY